MADALAEQGCAAGRLDLGDGVGASAAGLGERRGVPTLGLRADVTDDAALASAFGRVLDELGTPSVLVNAAGVAAWSDAEAMPAAEWRRVVDINLTGTFLACQSFARSVFAAGGSGSIVNVSSMSAFVVNVPQRQAAYNASKAAVDQLTRSLAVEWVARGIRVNAIAPGYFLSDMTRQFIDSTPETGEASSCSWPRTRPATSWGSRSSSTAATRWSEPSGKGSVAAAHEDRRPGDEPAPQLRPAGPGLEVGLRPLRLDDIDQP